MATPAHANSSASVARSIAYLQDAIRKDEKHKTAQVAALTPDQEDEVILDYIETMEPARREQWLERLNELQAESVLG
jgi:inactivated superfamily I helicase